LNSFLPCRWGVCAKPDKSGKPVITTVEIKAYDFTLEGAAGTVAARLSPVLREELGKGFLSVPDE